MSDPAGIVPTVLTDEDKAVLDMAGRTYRHSGAREQAIHDELSMTPTRYAQRLAALLGTVEALAYAPSTVKRHLRLREAAQAARADRLAG